MNDQPHRTPLDDGELLLDVARTIVTASPPVLRLFGCSPEAIRGLRFDRCIDRSDRKGRSEFNQVMLSTPVGGTSDLLVRLEVAGARRLVRLRMLRGKDGWRVLVEAIADNESSLLSELVRGQRWRSIAYRTTDGAALLDLRGAIVECNWRFVFLLRALTGGDIVYGEEAVVGRRLEELDAAQALAPVIEALAIDPPKKRRFCKCIAHNQVVVEVDLAPSAGPDGGFAGCLLIFRDKTIEHELRAAQVRAEQANRAKSEFLAVMSHEIRTPLNGILGLTEALLTAALASEQEEDVRHIRNSGRLLLSIINDILDFSKIEAGSIELERIPIPLRATCEEVSRDLELRATEKSVRFELDIDADLPPAILGDPVRIKQIILNLAGNAVKFTERGSIRLALARAGDAGDRLHLRVIDTGVGIPADALPRLFDKFTQADASTTRRFGGTGLGLAVTRKLVELMEGTITVESTLGVGTTFTVDVPLRGAELPAAAGRTDGDSEHLPELRGDVLLVDDNRINLLVARKFLARFGLTVTTAQNGREAVDAVSANDYDLILMDCQMPEMDGFEATRTIRAAEPADRRVPIIALTANALAEDRQRCAEAGMDDHVAKPIVLDELSSVLCRFLAANAPPPGRAATRTPAPRA